MVTRRKFIAQGLPLLLSSQYAISENIYFNSDINFYKLNIELSNPTERFLENPFLKFYLPMNIGGRQELINVSSDDDFYVDKLNSGNNILHIKLDKIEPWNTRILHFLLNIDQFPSSKKTSIPIENSGENSLFYKVNQKDRELLLNIAQSLKSGSEINTIKNTFDWVTHNIKPLSYNPSFLGINEIWENKSGDCSEFSLLTSNLLKINVIASRNMAGFLLHNDKKLSMKFYHNWCECFVDKVWLIVDAYTQTLSTSSQSYLATQAYEINDNEIGQSKYLASDGIKIKI